MLRDLCTEQCCLVGVLRISPEASVETVGLDSVILSKIASPIWCEMECFVEKRGSRTRPRCLGNLWLYPIPWKRDGTGALLALPKAHVTQRMMSLLYKQQQHFCQVTTESVSSLKSHTFLDIIGVTAAFFTTPLDVIKTRMQLTVNEKGVILSSATSWHRVSGF